MGSSGENIYQYVSNFETSAITEAIDGFNAQELDLLMVSEQASLKHDVSERVVDTMINPQILHGLVDRYFADFPNPAVANRRLQQEILPVRMKCEVNNVPVTSVSYEYKGVGYSAYVYGTDGLVWAEGDRPAEFTWKIGVLIGLVFTVVAALLLAGLAGR